MDRCLGQISYAKLKFLNDELMLPHKSEQDYRLNRNSLALLKTQGADANLTNILEKAMDDKDEVEFYWINS